ncbi:MAG: tripartite tricarboxylate transporter permease [Syntrophales bacterium]|nr:tripartite tricarboxylate transporter permease [Syntrophales bacterium]
MTSGGGPGVVHCGEFFPDHAGVHCAPLGGSGRHLFGPPEYFALTFMGLTLVSTLGGDAPLKAFISSVLGLLIAYVGIDAMSGIARFTFGSMNLLDAVGFIGMAVGLSPSRRSW